MFFIISKLLSFLLHPFSWIVILLVAAIFFKQARRKMLVITFFVTYFFSNALIFNEINRFWELPSAEKEVMDKKYDVAIVLGGMMGYDEGSGMISFQENIDRLLVTLPMYHSGRIEKILFSGGSGSLIDDELESEVARKWLMDIGIPANDILIENQSRNTYENAIYSAAQVKMLNNAGEYLLITSAIHMRRAKACFEKAGLEVDIYPVDHMSSQRVYYFNDYFMPQGYVLDRWKQLLHECVGYLVYKMKGYC